MKTLRALVPLALLTFAGIAPAEEPRADFAALGHEIVARVRDEFLDAERAARWAEENAGYADRIADAETFRRETRGRLAGLRTSHTAYYTPDDPGYYELLSIFEPVLKKPAETESLGLAAVELDGGWFVARVFAGGPAEAAGIRRGDRIAAADGRPFHPRKSLAGKAGKAIVLEVRSRKDGPARTVSVVPRRVDPKQEWLEAQRAGTRIVEVQGRRVGYAPLWSCAGAQFQEALEEALQGDLAGADALVVDLRGGWGGCNPTFVNLFNPMVPEMERIDREGGRTTFSASWRKPLVVLVDGGSRSGKEMIARALQRQGRAVLVGERTAGAVVAGKPILLPDGSLLYLAVEDVRVDGERLEGAGVTPDVTVPAELPYAEGRDPQLERALGLGLKPQAGLFRPSGRDGWEARTERDKSAWGFNPRRVAGARSA